MPVNFGQMSAEEFQALIDASRDAATCRHPRGAHGWAKAHGCQLPHCGDPLCRLCPGAYQPPRREVMIQILSPRFAAMDWAYSDNHERYMK